MTTTHYLEKKMPLRAIAIELYRAQQKVHQLEDRLASAAVQERDAIRQELRGARAERDQLRRLVEAKKDDLPFRKTFQDR